MTGLLLGLLLAAAPAPVPGPVRLAAPGFSLVRVDAQTADFLLEYFNAQLVASGRVQVTTQKELSSLLGYERQRQLLACEEGQSSCLAELAGALGVDGLVVGSLARTRKGLTLTLKVLSTQDARTLATFARRAPDEDALLEALGEEAKRLVPLLVGALGPQVAAPPAQPAPPSVAQVSPQAPPVPAAGVATQVAPAGRPVWLPATAGGVLLVLGGVSYGLARAEEAALRDASGGLTDYEQAQAAVGRGRAYQVASVGLAGLGVAGLGLAAWMMMADAPATVALSAGPQGVGAVVGGRWP